MLRKSVQTQPTGSAVKTRPQLRLLFSRLLLVLGGIVIALVIAELCLRLSGFTYFNPYIVDADVGYSLRPGAEGWWQKEGHTYIKINSHGFRDLEHTIEKPTGTFRIAILGDSFAEALQVPLEKTFWSEMEPKLQHCPQLAKQKGRDPQFWGFYFFDCSRTHSLAKAGLAILAGFDRAAHHDGK